MHLNVHCNTIYNVQDMETTYMSTDRWMEKDVAQIYSGLLLSHKKNELMQWHPTPVLFPENIHCPASTARGQKVKNGTCIFSNLAKDNWAGGPGATWTPKPLVHAHLSQGRRQRDGAFLNLFT